MLLTDALNVLAELPCQAEPLPVFAARVLNRHAHDLGDDTPLATLILRALATLYGTVPPAVRGGTARLVEPRGRSR
ncbi:TIGR02679 domain-containing protein [Streptomyces sp. JV185]|nr:TIGR02679 domain-containing protein [Streptomyces sp. JV185]MEE1773977.1 TIGR02679 domain-containing protein [Streptomyces sp. JV185]